MVNKAIKRNEIMVNKAIKGTKIVVNVYITENQFACSWILKNRS